MTPHRPSLAALLTAPLLLAAPLATAAEPPPLAEPAPRSDPAPVIEPAPLSDPALVAAQAEPATLTEPATADDDEDAIGLNLDLALATAYVFRGWNVFQQDRQLDQHMLFAPGLTWAIADSGVSVGYWGAYQLNGPNVGANADAALNLEQDLFVSYDLELPHDLGLTFGLLSYLYPAADPEVVGTSFPVYLDPVIGLSYATAVDLGINVSYLLGLQDEPAVRGASYLYLNPVVGKSVEIADWVGLEVAFGYGFKIFNEGNEGRDNVHDLLLSTAVPFHPGGGEAYVKPGIHLAWTNVEDVLDEETEELVEDKGFADGLVLWGSLSLGMDI